jgi:plasmid stability protein
MSKVIAGSTRPRTVTVLVDDELRARLEQAAAAHERSLGGELRALMRRYLDEPDEQEDDR